MYLTILRKLVDGHGKPYIESKSLGSVLQT
jgi:hypothetical protein